jgi:hypothetical protein
MLREFCDKSLADLVRLLRPGRIGSAEAAQVAGADRKIRPLCFSDRIAGSATFVSLAL